MADQKMTVEQFGQVVKRQYPAYANRTDAAVGAAMLQKYPQYASRVAPATPTVTERPTSTIGPAKTGTGAWLSDLENDLRGGGSRTAVGRGLGWVQGRGGRGYTGMESGSTKGAADIVESVPLGAVKTAQGIVDYWSGHPFRGGAKALGGISQMATIPSAFVGGPVLSKAAEAVPSAKWAGKMFDLIENGGKVLDSTAPTGERFVKGAGAVPVKLSRSGDKLLALFKESKSGGTLPKAARDLMERYTGIVKQAVGPKQTETPLTYEDARRFYSNITSLSASDKMATNPRMAKMVGELATALRQDIGDAAAQVGQGARYYAAMKEYARAKAMARVASEMGKWALRAGGTALGVGGATEVAKKIWSGAK